MWRSSVGTCPGSPRRGLGAQPGCTAQSQTRGARARLPPRQDRLGAHAVHLLEPERATRGGDTGGLPPAAVWAARATCVCVGLSV